MNPRTLFFVLAGVLIISAGLWTWKEPLNNRKEIQKYEAEFEEVNQKFEALASLAGSYDVVQKRYEELTSEFDSLQKVIPDRNLYVRVLENIKRLAENKNVKIVTISPIREDSFPAIKDKLRITGEYIERYPVQVELRGDFLSLGEFLVGVLAMPAIVNIGRVSMETDMEEAGVLTCELLLYTYIFVEKA